MPSRQSRLSIINGKKVVTEKGQHTAYLINIMKLLSFYRNLALLLTLILGSFTMNSASRYFWHDGVYYYTQSNGNPYTAMVAQAPENGYNGLSGTVAIPESFTVVDTINGDPIVRDYTVTGIYSSAFKGCVNITAVQLPNTITRLYSQAFEGCTGLSDIEIPNSVTNIEKKAFYGCTGLLSITVPESVMFLGDSVFAKCNHLTAVTWNAISCDNSGGWDGKLITQLAIGNKVKIIPKNFMKEGAITSLDLPSSLTRIGDEAFRYCTNLTEIVIPDSVTHIGSYAFCNDSNLVKITIGRSVRSISSSFSSNPSLRKIQWNAINSFSAGLGTSLSKITEIKVGDGVEYIPNGLFNYSSVSEAILPNSVKELGYQSFCSCKRLKTVKLSESLTTIGDMTFSGCDSITSLVIPNSVTVIEKNAFSHMKNLVDLTLSNNLDSVGSSIISECLKLNHLVIPKSLRVAAPHAFNSVRINSFTVEDGNPYFDSRNNCNGIIETATNTLIAASNSLTVIPEGVTAIGDYAFDLCAGPSFYDIPEGVTKIGERAFFRCWNLSKIIIPSTVDTICDLAFYYTTMLDTVICKAAIPPVINDELTFDWYYNKDAVLYVPAESVEAYKNANVWEKFQIIVPIGTVLKMGDVNLDGKVNIEDVIKLIDILISNDTAFHRYMDMNWDNKISIIDVTRLIDLLLEQ